MKRPTSGKKKIVWFDVHAGDVARDMYYPAGQGRAGRHAQRGTSSGKLYLPDDTLKAFEYYSVGLKGPLTTPIGGGFRSINVYLRIRFDLYACVRPVKYFKGVEAPNKRADKVDMFIFRENTEDVYCGIEFKSSSDKAKKVIGLLTEMGYKASCPIVRHRHQADEPGREQTPDPHGASTTPSTRNCPSVTLMHKGNIMKFTEGAFKDWGYELARRSSATRS